LTSKNNYFKLSLILVIITISIALFGYVLVAYAGGPRLDYDEAYTDILGAPECWVDV
jgi:ABC-type transporter Mla subunit MlaD